MGTELLLTGLFVLLVLGLLVAFVYSMAIMFNDTKAQDETTKEAPGQRRFLTASLLNFLLQK